MNPVLQSLLIYFLQLCTISVPSCQLTHCFRMQSQVILGFAPQTIAVTITIITTITTISISIVIVAIILEAAHPISATFFPFLPFLSMPRIFDQPAPRSPISNISSLDILKQWVSNVQSNDKRKEQLVVRSLSLFV